MGVTSQKIKKIAEELCGDRIPRSTISAWHKDLDDDLAEFLERRLEYDNSYMVVDAQVHKGFCQRKKHPPRMRRVFASILVAGTVYAPDWYTIPTVSVRWIYKGVKQGAKKLERLGIIV